MTFGRWAPLLTTGQQAPMSGALEVSVTVTRPSFTARRPVRRRQARPTGPARAPYQPERLSARRWGRRHCALPVTAPGQTTAAATVGPVTAITDRDGSLRWYGAQTRRRPADLAEMCWWCLAAAGFYFPEPGCSDLRRFLTA